MFVSDKNPGCLKVIHVKSDDFKRVIYFKRSNGNPLDLSGMTLRWDFYRDNELIFSIYGQDIEIQYNAAIFEKESSFFASLPLIGSYTHRLYDVIKNETLLFGAFVLEEPAVLPFAATPLSSFYGPAAASVVDSEGILSLAYNSPGSATTFTLQTGTAQSKFIIAIPANKSIVSVIDQSALNIDVTAEYEAQGIVNMGNVDYQVYEMNLSVPYSSNHNHFVTIQ